MKDKKSVDIKFNKKNLSQIKNISKESPELFEDLKKADAKASQVSYGSKNTSILYREKITIIEWRQALQQAENSIPTYWRLIRLFRELVLDADVTALMDLRINNVMSRSFTISKDDNKSDDLTKYFDKTWFAKWRIETMKSFFIGYTLLKFGDIINDEIQEITALKPEFFNPITQELLFKYTDVKGKNIHEDSELNLWLQFVSPFTKENYYEGLFVKLAPYTINLRMGMNAFADYLRRTANGQLIVKTDLTDEKNRKNVEEYAKNLNSSNWALINAEDDISFLEANGKGADNFRQFILEMKNAISKIVLGTDTITTEKAFVGSAMIAASQSHLYSKSDIYFVEHAFDELVKKMVNLGITQVEGCKLEIDKMNILDLGQEFSMVTQLLSSGEFELTDENWFMQKFGLPIKKKITSPDQI